MHARMHARTHTHDMQLGNELTARYGVRRYISPLQYTADAHACGAVHIGNIRM